MVVEYYCCYYLLDRVFRSNYGLYYPEKDCIRYSVRENHRFLIFV